MSKQVTAVDDVKNTLKLYEPQFKVALPSHISVDKFMRVAQTAITMNPNLLKADRQSLLASCMILAQQGLLPDGRESALVPFGDKITPMPMIAGILKKVRQSGEIATIFSEIVYDGDQFKYWIDSDGPHLEHRPEMFGDRGKMIGAYAFAKTKDGASYIEMLSMSDIEAIKKSSRSSGNGPWVSFPTEMIKKSCLRRLAKRLPSSTDLDEIHDIEDKTFGLQSEASQARDAEVVETKQVEAPKKKSNIEKIVEAKSVQQKEDVQPKENLANEVPI